MSSQNDPLHTAPAPPDPPAKSNRRWLRLAGLTVLVLVGFGVTTGVRQWVGAQDPDPFTVVTEQHMIDALRDALPSGTVTRVSGKGLSYTPGAPPPSADLVLRNKKGAASVQVQVQRLSVPVAADSTTCPERAWFPFNHCSAKRFKDGAVLMVDQGYVNRLAPAGQKLWKAVWTAPTGGQVTVTESDAPAPTRGPASPSGFAMTPGQLGSAASATAWAPLLDALTPSVLLPKPPSTPLFTRQRMLITAQRLLPSGVRVSDTEGSAKGYVDMLVTSRQGQGLVTITVQRWKPQDRSIALAFKEARTLAEGTKILARHMPAPGQGKDAVEWDADVLYADGRRVLVVELNAAAFGLPATQRTAPLTAEELGELALHPAWRG